MLLKRKRDSIKCTFEINGPNYGDGCESLMKLLSSRQTRRRAAEQNHCGITFVHKCYIHLTVSGSEDVIWDEKEQ